MPNTTLTVRAAGALVDAVTLDPKDLLQAGPAAVLGRQGAGSLQRAHFDAAAVQIDAAGGGDRLGHHGRRADLRSGRPVVPDEATQVWLHKWAGKYVVPGGHVELGETLEAALRREVAEETSLNIHDIRFVCVQEFIYDPAFGRRPPTRLAAATLRLLRLHLPRRYSRTRCGRGPPERRGRGIRLGRSGRGAAPAGRAVHGNGDPGVPRAAS
jgi:8-oxo-dGTP pyrophosphatase MutT (NUDIX family)